MATGLHRDIGLFGAVAYGVGTILGAGVYALIGLAAGKAGNAVWLSFMVAAGVAAFSGLSYARLAAIFPVSGAEYVYVEESFGSKFWAFIVGWLVLLSGLISGAAVALGFGGYFSSLVHVPVAAGATLLILGLSVVSYLGIKESITVNIILTVIELSGIMAMIIFGLGHLGTVDLTVAPSGLAGIIGAVGVIFFAFVGFEGLVKIGEETRDPTRTIPRALILSLIITTIIYVLVAVSVVNIVPYTELATSSSPLSDAAMAAQGPTAAFLMSLVAMISTANTVLIILIATSRVAYGMSVRSALPGILTSVHPERGTPRAAILLTMLASIVFCFLGGIEVTANVANFTIFLVFLAVNLAVIKFSRKGWNVGRPYVLSASFGVVTSFLLLTQFGWEVAALSTLIIAVGVLVYLLLRSGSGRVKWPFP